MKLFRLTYNELVKQFKKPSIKIMFAVILIAAIALPFGVQLIPEDIYSQNALESNKFMLEQENANVEKLASDKTQKGKIEYKYATIERDYRELFVTQEIGFEDWREREAEQFRYALYNLAAIEFVLEGYSKDIIMEKLRSVDSKVVDSYFEMTLAKKKEVESKYIEQAERIKNIILNKDYQGHTQEEINRNKEFIATLNNYIVEYDKLKDKNPKDEEGKSKLAQLEKQKNDAIVRIPRFNQDVEILQFRLDNNIDYSANNWKNNAIITIEKELADYRIDLLSESDYSSQASMLGYSMTYDEYVKNYEVTNKKREEKISEIWYGLQNNIPKLSDVKDARSVLDSSYEIFIILAVIMVIIIGGGIVSTEFSKGTIRLLLIRPVARWKVLLSKLLAILVVGVSIVIIGVTILYISTGYVFDFATYNTPILQTVNGEIVKVSYISFLIPKIILSCSSLIFIISLVFMISTLAKNTALAVAISMVLYLGVAPLTDILVSINQAWIVGTFIPYINSSYLRLMPTTSNALSESFGMSLNFQGGATQLLILSAIMLVVTFVIFVKKDVKN